MTMPLATALALATQCAPSVAPETLLSVVHVESRFNPLAIGVNGTPRVAVTATSKADAIARATALIRAGRSVDLGLAQINSKNLGWLNLSVENAFDPCANLTAAARVLQDGYGRSNAAGVGEQAALQAALSRYNTGDPRRGFANGYVGKVTRAFAQIVPAIRAAPSAPRRPNLEPEVVATDAPRPPPWDVFGQVGAGSGFVIRITRPAEGASS